MMQPSYKLYRLAANRLERLQTSVPSGEFIFPSVDAALEWCFTYLEVPEDKKWRFVRPDITKPIAPCNLDVALDHTPDMPYLRYHRKANETLMPSRSYNDIRLNIWAWREENGVDNFEFDGMMSAIEWCYNEFNPSVVFEWKFATENGVFRPGEISIIRTKTRKKGRERRILHPVKPVNKNLTGTEPEMVGRRFRQWKVTSPEYKFMSDHHKYFHMRCVNCGEEKWIRVSRFSGGEPVNCPCTSSSLRMYKELPKWLTPSLMRRIYDLKRYIPKEDFHFDSPQDCAIWCYKNLPFPDDPNTPWTLKKGRGKPMAPDTLWLEVEGVRSDTVKNIATVNKSRRSLRKKRGKA